MGVIAFDLGAVVLGLDRLHVAQSRPECAIGWVLVLCGALTMMFIAIRMALDVTEGCYLNGTQGTSENALARQPDFREA